MNTIPMRRVYRCLCGHATLYLPGQGSTESLAAWNGQVECERCQVVAPEPDYDNGANGPIVLVDHRPSMEQIDATPARGGRCFWLWRSAIGTLHVVRFEVPMSEMLEAFNRLIGFYAHYPEGDAEILVGIPANGEIWYPLDPDTGLPARDRVSYRDKKIAGGWNSKPFPPWTGTSIEATTKGDGPQ